MKIYDFLLNKSEGFDAMQEMAHHYMRVAEFKNSAREMLSGDEEESFSFKSKLGLSS